MGMVAPLAIGLATSYFGRKVGAGKGGYAGDAGRGELATGAINSARLAGSTGTSIFNTAQPLLSTAASYYTRLLGNDRMAQQEAVAPQRQALEENYLGAERGLKVNPSLRGGARSTATAELARQ